MISVRKKLQSETPTPRGGSWEDRDLDQASKGGKFVARGRHLHLCTLFTFSIEGISLHIKVRESGNSGRRIRHCHSVPVSICSRTCSEKLLVDLELFFSANVCKGSCDKSRSITALVQSQLAGPSRTVSRENRKPATEFGFQSLPWSGVVT